MIRFSNLIISAIFLVCLTYFPSIGQQNLLDYKNSLLFARYLKASAQFDFASQEYERLHFMQPGDSTIIFEMVQNYRLDKQYDKLASSFGLFNKYIFHDYSPVFEEEYLKFSISCKSEDKQFFQVSSLLQPNRKCFYELSYYWSTKNYDSVFSYNLHNENLLKANSLDLYQLTNNFSHERNKSPLLAGLMSTILPGSGKAYLNRWGDALISLLFVSTNTFVSYRAFHKKGLKSPNGWIFGSLSLSFYLANIYGSAKSAKKYNSDLKDKYQKRAEDIIYSTF
jgi:hypothetical protein